MVQLNLPSTYLTANGFTVSGAGVDLLKDLLAAFDEETERRGGSMRAHLRDGISEDEVLERLAPIGVTPPAELVAWWGWHNGPRPEAPRPQSRWEPMALERAISNYERSPIGLGEGQWNPEWLRFAGTQPNSGWAISCASEPIPPLVRATDWVEATTQPEVTHFQVVSLCTPITWWLTGIVEGWTAWDESREFWVTDIERFPSEWRGTDIL